MLANCLAHGRRQFVEVAENTMIHITAQMRVLVAIKAVDGRKGIDSRHAGENLADVLRQRSRELPRPIQMCDALSRNVPKTLA